MTVDMIVLVLVFILSRRNITHCWYLYIFLHEVATMADSNANKSIAERSSDVRGSLLDVLEKSKTAGSPVEVHTVEDLLDRFKLWTGNLGALHQAHKRMSLESRLADSPEVRDQICEHLDDMQEAPQDCTSIL